MTRDGASMDTELRRRLISQPSGLTPRLARRSRGAGSSAISCLKFLYGVDRRLRFHF